LFSNSVFAECKNTSIRTIFGKEPIASKLYEAAKKTKNGAWKEGSFESEEFHYLGKSVVNLNTLFVTYIDTSWGTSTCRGTQRLMFFNKDFIEVAQYYGVAKPNLKNSTLIFPVGELGSSSVNIASGLPKYLNDGDDHIEISRKSPNKALK